MKDSPAKESVPARAAFAWARRDLPRKDETKLPEETKEKPSENEAGAVIPGTLGAAIAGIQIDSYVGRTEDAVVFQLRCSCVRQNAES